MRDKQGQTNNKVAHPRHAVTFAKKNELPQVGLEPTTLYTLDRALYQLSYLAQLAGPKFYISYIIIVHLMNRLIQLCPTSHAVHIHAMTVYNYISVQSEMLASKLYYY